MNFNAAKTVIGIIAGFGASAIAENAMRIVRPTNVRGFTKVATFIGSVMLSSYIGDRVSEHTGVVLDTIKEAWEKRDVNKEETETEGA